jgi:hypothetical protein
MVPVSARELARAATSLSVSSTALNATLFSLSPASVRADARCDLALELCVEHCRKCLEPVVVFEFEADRVVLGDAEGELVCVLGCRDIRSVSSAKLSSVTGPKHNHAASAGVSTEV